MNIIFSERGGRCWEVPYQPSVSSHLRERNHSRRGSLQEISTDERHGKFILSPAQGRRNLISLILRKLSNKSRNSYNFRSRIHSTDSITSTNSSPIALTSSEWTAPIWLVSFFVNYIKFTIIDLLRYSIPQYSITGVQRESARYSGSSEICTRTAPWNSGGEGSWTLQVRIIGISTDQIIWWRLR